MMPMKTMTNVHWEEHEFTHLQRSTAFSNNKMRQYLKEGHIIGFTVQTSPTFMAFSSGEVQDPRPNTRWPHRSAPHPSVTPDNLGQVI